MSEMSEVKGRPCPEQHLDSGLCPWCLLASRDAKIAEQAQEIERLTVQLHAISDDRQQAERERDGARDLVHEWATKHGELNAQLDEARRALVWVGKNWPGDAGTRWPDEHMPAVRAAGGVKE